MNFAILQLTVFSYFLFAFCEKCSKTLHEAFRKGFDLNDDCIDCTIKSPGVSIGEDNWEGFCTGNRFFLFKNRKCNKDCELLNRSDSVAIITNESCELVKKYYDLDETCLKKLDDKIFKRQSEPVVVRTLDKEKEMDDNVTIDLVTRGGTVAFSTPRFIFGKQSTRLKIISLAKTAAKTTITTRTNETSLGGTTCTEETSAEATISEKTETTNTRAAVTESTVIKTPDLALVQIKTNNITRFPDAEKMADWTTTNHQRKIGFQFVTETKKICEPNEFFFKNHCYFIKLFDKECHDLRYNLKIQIQNRKENTLLDIINSTAICQSRHSKALGLAVETEEENKFILKILKTIYFYKNFTLFTSGVRTTGSPDRWQGWNSTINRKVLNFKGNNFQPNNSFYCINVCDSHWYLLSFEKLLSSQLNCFVVCERLYNPKNIQPELYEQCLELYRKSSCYDLYNHSNFCCEKDETGEIWFECPNKTHTKAYPNSVECSWTCESEGFFTQDRPTCKGRHLCSDSYNSIKYVAPPTRYAISDCPKHYFGHSTWYCDWSKTFLGKPDYSLCCENTNLHCRSSDIFLNVWMGCPLKTIKKRTACPPGTLLEEAVAEWYCQENGTFNGTAPNYSNCNVVNIECTEMDRYGVKWVVPAGTVGKNDCPSSSTGFCYWKCEDSGKFDGPEPDCSQCKSAWMEEVAQKIKNHSNHEEVMKIMENYTEKEDLRIGYGQVLALTDDCVVLFKKQNPDCKIYSLDKFLKIYSKILRNVAGNPNLWLSFSISNRQQYAERILRITQKAAFANLDSKDWFREQYNATFAKFERDGFDFFVAYNPLELKFPLENSTESNWHLDIRETGERNFTVMGLVMNYSLSSLMFPRGNQTMNLEMNSPAVTFTVAASKNGEVVIDSDVVVSISFKHKTRTRLPLTEIIARKLHEGEVPSGVFNSTLCYYYRNPDWNTEGCSVTFTSKDRTDCTCSHLSTIGLLMSIHKYKPNKTLEFVSVTSSSITIVSLILTLLAFFFFDKVKNDRVLIGKNLCFCLLLGHTMLITVMDKKFFNIPDNFCMVYAVLLHYVFMAAFAWMFVEGYHLYRMLVLVFDSDIEYRWIYILIGYGGPFIIVAITIVIGIILKEQPYGQDELCWLKPPNYVWAFVGPVIASTSINFCILITSMKLAISSKRRTEKFSLATLKLWIKGWISLSTLLGITWFFGLAYIHYNEAFVYLFVIFNGLQGFFIFIFRCVLCEQYKSSFLKKVKSGFSNLKVKGFKKSENVKSETKLFVISASKSSDEMEAKDSGYDPGTEGVEDSKEIQSKATHFKSKSESSSEKNSCGVDIDINVTLKPTLSVDYLRNRAIAKNFSVRKSKATWLADSCDFSELSYHNIYRPN